MKLLIPLGLLGLLGIVILIIIYIIKPNYQQKFVSSTYIWKLSLKLKRKKLPTNKLRNILIFVCQVLILTALTGILTKPVIMQQTTQTDDTDVIAIVDSSASMYTQTDGETRFERALIGVQELSDLTLSEGGYMSVIIADQHPYYLDRRVPLDNKEELIESLNALIDDDTACSYGVSDIDGAITLCEEVLLDNPNAQIYLYTDTTYTYVPDGITVVPVTDDSEWNIAILDAYTEQEDGYYTITVEIACYGSDRQTTLYLDINNANAYDNDSNGDDISLSQEVTCRSDETQRIVFKYGGGTDDDKTNTYYSVMDNKVYSYQSILVYFLNEDDSFADDNVFNIYGGQKEVLKVLYASNSPNSFFNDALSSLRTVLSDRWDLQITETKFNITTLPTEGYNFYIYEHKMPDTMPVDGVVFLVDPDKAPLNSGFSIQSVQSLSEAVNFLAAESDSTAAVTKYMDVSYIQVTQYTQISCEAAYETIMTCAGDPALVVQNDGSRKIAIMPFSVHYSNLVMLPEFLYLLYDLFEYFIPSTTSETSFAVGESFSVNARGAELDVIYANKTVSTLTTFPSTLSFTVPGTYTLSQTTYFGYNVATDIFIQIPREESNIFSVEDGLTEPVRGEVEGTSYDDLLVYLAAALVALIFIEWLLHTRENI